MITLHDVSKTYSLGREKIHALDRVSLKIKEGEFTALMGPSGSGKSTLLNIIGGLDVPTHGTVLYSEHNLHKMNDVELSHFRNANVGFIFQDPLLLPHLTVLENVMTPLLFATGTEKNAGKNSEHDAVHKLLREVGLEKRLHHKPSQLSGGQKQRVCIARALVTGASLILADEPTGNLDTKTSRDILELFARLHKERNCTFIIATHDPEIARWAKREIEIQDGVLT